MTDRERVQLLIAAADACLAELHGQSRTAAPNAIEAWRNLINSTPAALIKECAEAWLAQGQESALIQKTAR